MGSGSRIRYPGSRNNLSRIQGVKKALLHPGPATLKHRRKKNIFCVAQIEKCQSPVRQSRFRFPSRHPVGDHSSERQRWIKKIRSWPQRLLRSLFMCFSFKKIEFKRVTWRHQTFKKVLRILIKSWGAKACLGYLIHMQTLQYFRDYTYAVRKVLRNWKYPSCLRR
jgi:hypothetical protein